MATELTAKEDTLGEIHNLTALLMRKRLQQALIGEIDLPPSELSAITKFLKDNNIECTEEEMQSKFGDVLKLPDLAEVEADFG